MNIVAKPEHGAAWAHYHGENVLKIASGLVRIVPCSPRNFADFRASRSALRHELTTTLSAPMANDGTEPLVVAPVCISYGQSTLARRNTNHSFENAVNNKNAFCLPVVLPSLP